MKEYFSDEHIKNELNKIYLEEDDVMLIAEFIEGEGKNYTITGQATIDGETYNNFQVELQLEEDVEEETIESIMATPWDWYDFLC